MRLHRLESIYTDVPIYYVTICTHQRRHLLANPQVHDAFKAFAENAQQHDIFVGCYVLMPDHVHAFVAFGAEAMSLSSWVKSLKNILSKCLRHQNIPVPHFQKGFFDHVLRAEDSYFEKSEYMFLNPVRAGLVTKPEDWQFQGEMCELNP